MKKFLLLIICVCALTLISCKKDNKEVAYWGNVNYYDDFLWRKHVPDTIERMLKVDFNEDAINDLDGNLMFELYQRLPDNKYAKTTSEDVELYVDGVKSENNTICIRLENCDEEFHQQISIRIVLTAKTLYSEDIDRDYHYVLKMVENPGIDRINNCTISDKTLLLDEDKDTQTPIVVKVRHVSNKLRVWVDSILSFLGILMVCILVLWFLIIKRVYYPKIKVAIDINGAYYLHKSKNKYRMIVLCDNKYKKQSLLNKLFTGEILYSVNDMWCDGAVLIKPSGKTVRIKLDDKYIIKPYELTLDREVEYKITNSLKQSVQIIVS